MSVQSSHWDNVFMWWVQDNVKGSILSVTTLGLYKPEYPELEGTHKIPALDSTQDNLS